MERKIAALYQFKEIANPLLLKEQLELKSKEYEIVGMLMIAKEGINGTISGKTPELLEKFLSFIINDLNFHNLELKYSFFNPIALSLPVNSERIPEEPFQRMRISIRKEIVTFGIEDIEMNNNGILPEDVHYLNPKEWNDLLLHDEDTILIDTRNDYEYQIGTFQKAINPNTKTFREFPQFIEEFIQREKKTKEEEEDSSSLPTSTTTEGQLDSLIDEKLSDNQSDQLQKNPNKNKKKKLAIFCTGGIRCEKASLWLSKLQSFDQIYQLKGGILRYLEEVPPEDSLWEGECFVFDERVSVKHALEIGNHILCRACRYPLSKDELTLEDGYLEGIHCKHCLPKLTEEKKAALLQRQQQIHLAKEKNQRHLGYAHNSHERKKQEYWQRRYHPDQVLLMDENIKHAKNEKRTAEDTQTSQSSAATEQSFTSFLNEIEV